MCKLVSILGSTCRHTLKIEWVICEQAPRPNRCPTIVSCIDSSSLDPQTPFCARCAEDRKTKMIAEFHKQRREMTRVARARDWTDKEISELRVELRDQLYEKLKYVNKPLPSLPGGEGSKSGRGIWDGMEGAVKSKGRESRLVGLCGLFGS